MKIREKLKVAAAEAGKRDERSMDATSAGEWLEAQELYGLAAQAGSEDADVRVSVRGVDHLEAGAFQVLLALASGQTKRGCSLRVADASPALREWFAYAGADRHFSFE